jgi:hypothetical protein
MGVNESLHFELYFFGIFLTYLLFIVNYIDMKFLYSRLPNKCFSRKYISFKNSQFILAVIVSTKALSIAEKRTSKL